MSFDDLIPRRGSGSQKWDLRPDLDPFWIADMDFRSPEPVIDAIAERTAHGVFGYATPHHGLNEAVLEYLERRFSFSSDLDKVVYLGGLVPALSLAGRAFAKPGDAVLTCTPVYPPFLSAGKDGQLETVRVPHVHCEGRWTFDWEALTRATESTSSAKVFYLCSPQNPLGRCFTESEITRLAEFCLEKEILFISDEIHCDLVLDENETPFFSALNLNGELRKNTIVLLSPSKTYNIAGLGFAYAVIEDAKIRNRFKAARGHTLAEINCLSYFAAEAAYRHGEPWRRELVAYLRGNRDALVEYLESNLPEIEAPRIEATYLAWLDFSKTGLENPGALFAEQGLFLSDGVYFGAKQAVRFNFGCPRSRVLEGIEKIRSALRD